MDSKCNTCITDVENKWRQMYYDSTLELKRRIDRMSNICIVFFLITFISVIISVLAIVRACKAVDKLEIVMNSLIVVEETEIEIEQDGNNNTAVVGDVTYGAENYNQEKEVFCD